MNHGTYKDGGVHVVWTRIGARTWTTIAETDEDLKSTLAEAERLAGQCSQSPCRQRDYVDEIESDGAEVSIPSVVHSQNGGL